MGGKEGRLLCGSAAIGVGSYARVRRSVQGRRLRGACVSCCSRWGRRVAMGGTEHVRDDAACLRVGLYCRETV